MANLNYGYKHGPRVPRKVKMDSASAAIEVGDMLTLSTAGYFKECAADGEPVCVAMEAHAAVSADGDAEILADFSQESVYEYPPDTGTVTIALVGLLMDVGGEQQVNIDQSTQDSLLCVGVDTGANTVFVQIRPTASGV